MPKNPHLVLVLLILLLVPLSWRAPAASPQTECEALPLLEYQQADIFIETATGRHPLRVELAATRSQRALGLMCRQMMASDRGMLFIYGREQPVSMWMKNTFLPLDMLFIRADGTVSHVVERTVPFSLAAIPSRTPVLAVLELTSGTVGRLGIRPGDRVVHSAFVPPE